MNRRAAVFHEQNAYHERTHSLYRRSRSTEPHVRTRTLGIVGAGVQAPWQTRAIAATNAVDDIRIYSPSDTRFYCADDLQAEGLPASAVGSAAEVVAGASVVVTATTSTDPVFPTDALNSGALVVAVGAYNAEMQELEPAVFDRATTVFADVPEEIATIADITGTSLAASDLVSLAAVFEGENGREGDDEILVVENIGTAVLDAAAASHLYQVAREEGVGSELSL